MKITYTQTFPKDAASVLKMFCDPAYHEQLQKALGGRDIRQLEHSDDGKRFRIKLAYQAQSNTPLPGFVKKLVGETSAVTQTETWDRTTKKGDLLIQVKGLPGDMRCVTSLTEAGGTTTKTFNWEVTVKVPLVGGKVEELIVGDIKTKIKPEETEGRKLLAKY